MKYRIEGKTFVNLEDNKKTKSIKSNRSITHSHEWQKRQDASFQEYTDIYENGKMPDYVKDLLVLFRGYISNYILFYSRKRTKSRNMKLLDVGCGVSKTLPIYMRGIDHSIVYVGLDPIQINFDRRYLFVNARIEELMDLLDCDEKFDLFVFSTSLDHFEDIEDVAKIIKELSQPGALALFFVGLHDPEIVARKVGAFLFGRMFETLTLPKLLIRIFGAYLIRIPASCLSLMRRDFKLRNDISLDEKHFYYFTRESVRRYISMFGNILDVTEIPDTNAQFICCEING